MKKIIINIKNIFMYITLIWASVMSAVYLIILFEIPLFALISYLPLGELICEILAALLLFGIWVVPVLYIITVTLMILVRVKFKKSEQNKRMAVTTIILPLLLTVLMLLTNFMELLA